MHIYIDNNRNKMYNVLILRNGFLYMNFLILRSPKRDLNLLNIIMNGVLNYEL